MATRAKNSKWRRAAQIMLLAGAVSVLLVAAALQNQALLMRRHTGGAGIAPAATETPPALNLVVVGLGAFRGIAAEILWFRADRLQLEGRYFELAQLAGWITALDPYATEAWAYNAWNLAYNISALMLRPTDRLRWVWLGVRLLRDEALRWNPGDAQICRELAWLYLDKIGGQLDSAAPLYQQALAQTIALHLDADGRYPQALATQEALQRDWRLSSEQVATIEAETGPLDWRVPGSQALYWAWQGLARADVPVEKFKCQRMVCHALMALYERGRLVAEGTASGAPHLAPAPAILPALLRALQKHYETTQTTATRRLYGIYLVRGMRQAAHQGNTVESERLYTLLLKIAGQTYILPDKKELLKSDEMPPEFLTPVARPD